jgi:hypothetical protein
LWQARHRARPQGLHMRSVVLNAIAL